MFSMDIKDGFSIREVSDSELYKVLDEHFERVYRNRSEPQDPLHIEDHAKQKIAERKKGEGRYNLRLVVYDGEEAVGWHYGYSTNPETYYMQNSAIIEDYRNRGLYGDLLKAVFAKLKADGFQVISSIHHPNNAAILIPKLKQGFIISGMQVHEKFRLLIELKYFFDDNRRKSFNRQIGLDL